MKFSRDHVIVHMSLLAFLSTGAFSQGTDRVNSSCVAPEVATGDPASVTCQFSKDLSKIGKPATVYHKDIKGVQTIVVDCFWRAPDLLECKRIAPGYDFDKKITNQLTVTIPSASSDYIGTFECRTEPSYPADIQSCVFALKRDPPSTAANSGTSPGTNDNTEDDSADDTGLIVGVVVSVIAALVIAAAVFFVIRKRAKKTPLDPEQALPGDDGNNQDETIHPLLPDTAKPDLAKTDQTLEDTVKNSVEDKDDVRNEAEIRCTTGKSEEALRQKDCHLLIIGKTGDGKSTLGNTLLGGMHFQPNIGLETEKIGAAVQKATGGHLQVMDTPDIKNSGMEKDTMEAEVLKWKQFMTRGTGAILLVVRCTDNYSAHDYQIYQQIKSLWGDPSFFCQRLIVAFTFGDMLDDRQRQELTTNASPDLLNILRDANKPCLVFSKQADPSEKEKTFSTLLSLVDSMGQEVSAPGTLDVASDAGIPAGSQHIVLLIGKTGNGRSSVGNTLLGRDGAFETGCGMSSTTTAVQVKETARFKAVDTPDISDTEYNDKQRKVAVLKWKELIAPGPHAILLTVRCDVRYTAEEYDIYKQLKKLWGDAESFCRRLVVAFTFGDRQDGSIEEELKGSIPQELKNVLGDAGHRYVVFNNRAKPDDNKEAVNKLADIVWTIRQQNETERCLIVVGKTGNGRSSVGNTLLGKDEFETGCGMSSTTTEPKAATSEQPKIKVVDTPDISDNDHFTDKQRKEQLSLWKRLAAPGPHAILLTVRCDVRYTAEEYDIYKQLKTLWGDSFCKLLIVAFTFEDRQDADIEEELKSSVPVELKNVLKDANGRYVVFDNRAEPGEEFKTVNRLLDIVDKLSKTRSATGPRSRP